VDAALLALFAIGGLTIGVWLGFLQTRLADRRWQRDKKLQIYTSYLAEIVNYEITMIRRGGRPLNSQEEVGELEAGIARMAYAREAVRLVGARKVVDSVTKITDQATSRLMSLKDAHEVGMEPPDPERGTSLLEFIAAVRADLGFRE